MTLPVEVNPTLMYKSSGGYQIPRSLRFRASAPNYLTRLPSSAGNQQKWTLSFWVKRGKLANYNIMFNNNAYSGTYIAFGGAVADTLMIGDYGSSYNYQLVSTQVFRDTSAWYHFVIAFDTTQATASNRLKVYCNGSQITSFQTANYPTLNYNTYWNQTSTHYIGQASDGSPFDGYMTEINFVNGQQLDQTSFGETDATTGVWKPKKYTGSYGTNGFYLNFSDNSAATAAAIGKDYSGNGNNFTPNNISVTSGATYDSMIDTPTLYDDGTVYGRGNYATLNPLFVPSGTAPSISQGNLYYNKTVTGTYGLSRGNIGVSSGKFYWEVTIASKSTHVSAIGAENEDNGNTSDAYFKPTSYTYCSNGNKANNNAQAAYGASWTTGDVLSVALDMTAGTITFYKNGTSQGTAFTGLSGTIIPNISTEEGAGTLAAHFNFGQRPFAYTPPSGFKALNTQNLPEPTIKKGSSWFNTVTYTGNGAARSITGVGFQPDLVWIKKRDTATNGSHELFDVARGTTKYLNTDSTSAEATDAQSLTAFNSDGFSLGTNAFVNFNGNTFVGWNWKEGATPGFDVVAYSGPASPSVQSVAHNLGVKPDFMIVKARNLTGRNWAVYHKSLGATQGLRLNLTNATASVSTYWNNTEPTSSVFTLGTDNDVNANGYNYVAYLWAEVPGFSKFGSYTGNGSADGPFVYCGFRPRFVMLKRTNTAGDNWALLDTARNSYNYLQNYLFANLSLEESLTGAGNAFDYLSNGFKVRSTGNGQNGSGSTYIYAAFAENPFKYALAR